MRLSPGQSGATSGDRLFLLRRDRAAAPAMRALFPSIAQLRLELRFEGTAANIPVPQTHILHPAARAYFVFLCPYADCNGRFDLAAIVNAAVEDSLSRVEGLLECEGTRVGGHASRRLCHLHLHYVITSTRDLAP